MTKVLKKEALKLLKRKDTSNLGSICTCCWIGWHDSAVCVHGLLLSSFYDS